MSLTDPGEGWESCEHRWKFVRDWLGDPNVVNGTQDCSFWECTICGETTDCRPDGWDDPAELEADRKLDAMRDAAFDGSGPERDDLDELKERGDERLGEDHAIE